jgi:hypothetical protein
MIHPTLLRSVVAAGLLAIGTSASAVTTVGSLSNFDAVNDTGGETEGFEIEFEGLSSADVLYTFGGPYSRYGDPTTVSTPTGVIVRWAAQWDPAGVKFSTATPVAPANISPGGHDCYNGGPIGNYLSSGCEHFGVSLAKAEGVTTYRWLVADQAAPGQLIAGNNVRIPAPIFNVTPNADPAKAPDVQAVIRAPIPENEVEGGQGRFSDATWMKRIKTQIETEQEIALDDLLLGDDPAKVLFNSEVETEYEWYLIQSKNGVDESGDHIMDIKPGNAKKNIAIRYEYYDFAGTYDTESHEAFCSDGPNCEDLGVGGANMTDEDVAPFRGAFIGAQMAGVNLVAVPEPETYALFAVGALLVAGRLVASSRRSA